MDTIEVQVNGEARQLPADATVADLARALELPAEGVAIAVDDEVITGGAWGTTALAAGSLVDVLTAVQGG